MIIGDSNALQDILDGFGQGILIFDKDGKLVVDNLAVRTILGTDLNVLKAQGWDAATVLFNTKQTDPDSNLETIRSKALQSTHPIRFHIYRSGEHLPCWASAVHGEDGAIYTMLTLETPDWAALTDLMDRFHKEFGEAVDSTQGHIDIIMQTIENHDEKKETVKQFIRRISGFGLLISVHMKRVARYLEMIQRLENIRTGHVRERVQSQRRKVRLDDFFEDLMEELDEIQLVDPETEVSDVRSRIEVDVPDDLAVSASKRYLTRILHGVLRNAIMYSMKAAKVKITAEAKPQGIQIKVADEGYGIREKEQERVYEPFQRARQPQIISEFGYGLDLYLCKNEVEAMDGQMWFDSTEGVGTNFFIMLPSWSDESSSSDDAIMT